MKLQAGVGSWLFMTQRGLPIVLLCRAVLRPQRHTPPPAWATTVCLCAYGDQTIVEPTEPPTFQIERPEDGRSHTSDLT